MRKGFIASLMSAGLLGIVLMLSACSDGGGGLSTERDPDADASYRVTLTTVWSQANFSTNFPAGAHFTPLIGGTHSDQVIFWEPGQNASPGLESVAETGAQSIFAAEIEAAKAAGKAEFIVAASDDASASGSVVLEFDINELFPRVTLVSMVAPSPDWFIGVHDVELFDDTSGEWKQTVEFDLAVYDAGTESGQVFSLDNTATDPVDAVTLLNRDDPAEHDFVSGVGSDSKFIATLTFERIK